MSKLIKGWPKVAVVIVTWNGKKFLEECLPALARQSYPKNKVKTILVDNGSVDGTIDWIREKYPDIAIIKNKKNLGFAKSNNQGIKLALHDPKTKYLITLNNDTQAKKDWLENLVLFMEINKNVGISVSKMIRVSDLTIIDSAGDYFAKNTFRVVNRGYLEKDFGQFEKDAEILTACAASSIFRVKVLQETKLGKEFFDEDFGSYIEDVDLNLRARLLGWKISYAPKSVIYHVGSATASKLSKKFKEFVSRRNRILMSIKIFPNPYLAFILLKYIFPSAKGVNYYMTAGQNSQIQKIKNKKGRGSVSMLAKGYGILINKGPLQLLKKTYKLYISNNDPLILTPYEAITIQLKAISAALIYLPKMLKKRKQIQKSKKIPDEEIKRWFIELSILQKK